MIAVMALTQHVLLLLDDGQARSGAAGASPTPCEMAEPAARCNPSSACLEGYPDWMRDQLGQAPNVYLMQRSLWALLPAVAVSEPVEPAIPVKP